MGTSLGSEADRPGLDVDCWATKTRSWTSQRRPPPNRGDVAARGGVHVLLRERGPCGGARRAEGSLTCLLPPQNCMFDTCNCEKSEDCMCAALSSYVRACAARGVLLSGWRDGVCSECAG